jgi:hypothetical protein
MAGGSQRRGERASLDYNHSSVSFMLVSRGIHDMLLENTTPTLYADFILITTILFM